MRAGPSLPAPKGIPWEIVLVRGWKKLTLTFLGALALASMIWQLAHPSIVYDFIFLPDVVAPDSLAARQGFFRLAGLAAVAAAGFAILILRRGRVQETAWPLHRELLICSLVALPVLRAPAVEFDHPFFTAAIIVIVSLALAHAVSKELGALDEVPDLAPRNAHLLVVLGYITFVAVLGFISDWRFITFHAEPCDTSWEVGAIAGIVRHGIPTVSVAAWLYDGKPLPAPYFNDHAPFVDYLFAPFFAIYPNPRILFWLQAAFMGTGAFGAYLIGRRWFSGRTGGVLAAWLYLLNPSVQGFCLHDIHANIMVVPTMMLAIGFMEAGRVKTAIAFAILTAVCREEAPLYAACLGLYWMFSAEDRARFRIGLAILISAIALQAFFALILMPHFGGQPRWDHFNLFFDGRPSAGSMLGALLFNPVGALVAATVDFKLEYLAISLVSMGGVAAWGWRAGWFALPALLLLVPSGDPGFFSLGVNYSAPLVPAALMMGFAGIRHFLRREPLMAPAGTARRAAFGTYVLASALLANFLYGNIASKSYKLEYGQSPLRRENQRDYRDIVGYVDTLPPYGAAERALWDVIHHVPRNVPILTSWVINPQLSHYDVALVFGYSGGQPPPEERVKYIVIDKLPSFMVPTETDINRFRADARWRVFYENTSGVIFEKI